MAAVPGEESDFNLIPLLDLVLQMMMFFIIVVNFAEKENNLDVKLPESQTATIPDPTSTDFLFINIDYDGAMLVEGREFPLRNLSEIQYYLRQEAQHAKEAAAAAGDHTGQIVTTVVIRAHRDCDWKPIFQVLRTCQDEGFRKWQLRAYVVNTAAGG